SSASSTCSIPSQMVVPRGASHDGTCTPLVVPMGTALSLGCSRHESRLTSPCTCTGSPFFPIAGSIGNWLTSVGRYSSCCQPVPVQPLPEISLTIKQSDTDQRNIQIGRALDVIAGEDA